MILIQAPTMRLLLVLPVISAAAEITWVAAAMVLDPPIIMLSVIVNLILLVPMLVSIATSMITTVTSITIMVIAVLLMLIVMVIMMLRL